jgi:hypothetical protein
MKRPGNQCVRSIESRCGCTHEKGRWVTRFTVIHGSFDCVEPLTDVVHSGGQRRDSTGYLGAVHVWATPVAFSLTVCSLLAASLFSDCGTAVKPRRSSVE